MVNPMSSIIAKLGYSREISSRFFIFSFM